MIKYSYFPGCTLKNKAVSLDKYARASAEVLGFTLEEIPQWQCCGGVYTIAKDKIATRLASVRALAAAEKEGNALLTLCSACHNVIKQVNNDIKTNESIASAARKYMGEDEAYNGGTEVIHYLEVLRDVIGFDTLKSKVTNPLTGKKIGAYYGCLLLRPGKVMAMDDPENPKILEDFIRAIGAEPVIYAQRNECCGGYATIDDKSYATKRADIIKENAKNNQADMLITACPLCLYNLNKSNTELPVYYFTELLAEALGIKEDIDGK